MSEPQTIAALRQALAKLEEAYPLLSAADEILDQIPGYDDLGAWDFTSPASQLTLSAIERLKEAVNA